MDETLCLAIETFQRAVPKSQAKLEGQCYRYSVLFTEFLALEYGIYDAKVVLVNLAKYELDEVYCHKEWADLCGGDEDDIIHYAVEVNGTDIVDWTYKQFDSRASIPVTYRKNRYKGRIEKDLHKSTFKGCF